MSVSRARSPRERFETNLSLVARSAESLFTQEGARTRILVAVDSPGEAGSPEVTFYLDGKSSDDPGGIGILGRLLSVVPGNKQKQTA